MTTKAELRLALLECMEFFRDELFLGASDSPRLEEKYTQLRDRCADALGNPSVANAHSIREAAASGRGE